MSSFNEITDIPVIDSHIHIFPDKIAQALRRWFEKHAWTFAYQGSAEEYLEIQFDLGARALVFLPYAHNAAAAAPLNEFAAGLVRKYPQVVGLAAAHPETPDVKGLLRRAFLDQGLAGVKLHCHVILTQPDAPGMFDIYETALEYDKVVVIHAGREPSIDAYGGDVRRLTGVRFVKNILTRLPELKLVVPHFGFDETEEFFALLDQYPNLHLDTTMMLGRFFPVEVDPGLIAAHADRILYGTDYPHIPYPVDRELKALLELGLGREINRKILYENAAALYGLQGGA